MYSIYCSPPWTQTYSLKIYRGQKLSHPTSICSSSTQGEVYDIMNLFALEFLDMHILDGTWMG
jgi:hypothetical protein